MLVDEPFAGLTSGEVADFSALIGSFRAGGMRFCWWITMVDRVFAKYLGERVAEGTAEEVMRNETVRRVYLGGKIETAARPEREGKERTPLLDVR